MLKDKGGEKGISAGLTIRFATRLDPLTIILKKLPTLYHNLVPLRECLLTNNTTILLFHIMKAKKHLTIVIKLGHSYFPACTIPTVPTLTEKFPNPGTSSIVDEKTHQPLLSILSVIVETAVKLRNEGHKVIIVSSGAIGVGLRRMEVEKRPKHLPRVQVGYIFKIFSFSFQLGKKTADRLPTACIGYRRWRPSDSVD